MKLMHVEMILTQPFHRKFVMGLSHVSSVTYVLSSGCACNYIEHQGYQHKTWAGIIDTEATGQVINTDNIVSLSSAWARRLPVRAVKRSRSIDVANDWGKRN
jgi:hypothetical protein